jgi:hypothetical protein
MAWTKSGIKTSILGLLGGASMSDSMLQNRVEEIRQAMLDALGEHAEVEFPLLVRRLRYADDAQGLWYLRGELMASLCAKSAEADARQRLGSITAMFRGLLPGGLASRPSPLVD